MVNAIDIFVVPNSRPKDTIKPYYYVVIILEGTKYTTINYNGKVRTEEENSVAAIENTKQKLLRGRLWQKFHPNTDFINFVPPVAIVKWKQQ